MMAATAASSSHVGKFAPPSLRKTRSGARAWITPCRGGGAANGDGGGTLASAVARKASATADCCRSSNGASCLCMSTARGEGRGSSRNAAWSRGSCDIAVPSAGAAGASAGRSCGKHAALTGCGGLGSPVPEEAPPLSPLESGGRERCRPHHAHNTWLSAGADTSAPLMAARARAATSRSNSSAAFPVSRSAAATSTADARGALAAGAISGAAPSASACSSARSTAGGRR
mmetsp:Transcript_30250/g.94923  ORF Transcript_30250/g.94923 Transcript_30250/m.94923 type:complete len:230 (+) Transcript_30250:2480-3169(+)